MNLKKVLIVLVLLIAPVAFAGADLSREGAITLDKESYVFKWYICILHIDNFSGDDTFCFQLLRGFVG